MDHHTVLIVEDHEATRTQLARAFARRRWEVCAVGTLREALGSLDPAPDCLVLDLNLTDGFGVTVLEKIHADQIPVKAVAVTTGVSDSFRFGKLAAYHPSLIIMKPFDWEILVRYCTTEVARLDPV
jgi:DNA-binding response OmpR family regulator